MGWSTALNCRLAERLLVSAENNSAPAALFNCFSMLLDQWSAVSMG